jgi:hypothetical protein
VRALPHACAACVARQSGIVCIPLVAFEFDPAKSAANKVKHGIDFVEAQAIWRDDNRLERPARSTTSRACR